MNDLSKQLLPVLGSAYSLGLTFMFFLKLNPNPLWLAPIYTVISITAFPFFRNQSSPSGDDNPLSFRSWVIRNIGAGLALYLFLLALDYFVI